MPQVPEIALIVGVCSLFAFVGMWLFITRVLRGMCRMTSDLDFMPGPLLRESPWGSARINGVNASNCIKLAEYDDGWLLRIMPIFGRGKLWLPKQTIQIGNLDPGGFLAPKHRTIISGDHQIRLMGRLAEFIE